MAFANNQDIGARLGRTLTAGEETTVSLLLDGATAVIAEAAGKDDAWAAALSPVPGVLRFMAIEVVDRALANPNSLRSLQETLGQHSYNASFRDDAGLWLTKEEELLVRRTVRRSTSGTAQVGSLATDLCVLCGVAPSLFGGLWICGCDLTGS